MILDAISAGCIDDLTEFYSECQRHGIADNANLDLAHTVLRGSGEVGKEDSARAATVPALAANLARRPGAIDRIVEWALTDPIYRSKAFFHYVKALRSSEPMLLKGLGEAVRRRGREALCRTEDLSLARVAFEELLEAVRDGNSGSARDSTLGDEYWDIPSPDKLPRAARQYVLPKVFASAKFATSTPADRSRAQWMMVSAEELGLVLGLRLGLEEKVGTVASALKATAVPDVRAAARALADQHAVALATIERLDREGQTATIASDLLTALATDAAATAKRAGNHPLALGLLERLRSFSPALADAGLVQFVDRGLINAGHVIANFGKPILDRLPTGAVAARLLVAINDTNPSALTQDPVVTAFAQQVISCGANAHLPNDLRGRIGQHQTIATFCQRTRLDRDELAAVGAALAGGGRNRDKAEAQVVSAMAAALLQIPRDRVLPALETALLTVGPVFARAAGDPASDLYRALAKNLEKSPEFWSNDGAVHAMVAVGLYAATPDLYGMDVFEETRTIVSRVRHRYPATFENLRGWVKQWPDTSQPWWTACVRAGKPARRSMSKLWYVALAVLLTLAGLQLRDLLVKLWSSFSK